VEFEGSVVTVMFPVLFEVVVRTVVVDVIVIVNVWFALVVVSGPNVIIVEDGDCVVAFVVAVVGGRVVGDRVVDFFAGDLVGVPVVGLTVLLEVGSDEVNREVVCVDFNAETENYCQIYYLVNIF
jgi:hypothetical protein